MDSPLLRFHIRTKKTKIASTTTTATTTTTTTTTAIIKTQQERIQLKVLRFESGEYDNMCNETNWLMDVVSVFGDGI